MRLETDESEAFGEMMKQREAEAARMGAKASASSVVQALVRRALVEEGFLTTEESPKTKAKAPK